VDENLLQQLHSGDNIHIVLNPMPQPPQQQLQQLPQQQLLLQQQQPQQLQSRKSRAEKILVLAPNPPLSKSKLPSTAADDLSEILSSAGGVLAAIESSGDQLGVADISQEQVAPSDLAEFEHPQKCYFALAEWHRSRLEEPKTVGSNAARVFRKA
jgi:hypothetical protein